MKLLSVLEVLLLYYECRHHQSTFRYCLLPLRHGSFSKLARCMNPVTW